MLFATMLNASYSSSTSDLGAPGSFWFEFYEFLQKHFSKADATNFFRAFRQQHEQYLKSVSPADVPKVITQYQNMLQKK